MHPQILAGIQAGQSHRFFKESGLGVLSTCFCQELANGVDSPTDSAESWERGGGEAPEGKAAWSRCGRLTCGHCPCVPGAASFPQKTPPRCTRSRWCVSHSFRPLLLPGVHVKHASATSSVLCSRALGAHGEEPSTWEQCLGVECCSRHRCAASRCLPSCAESLSCCQTEFTSKHLLCKPSFGSGKSQR